MHITSVTITKHKMGDLRFGRSLHHGHTRGRRDPRRGGRPVAPVPGPTCQRQSSAVRLPTWTWLTWCPRRGEVALDRPQAQAELAKRAGSLDRPCCTGSGTSAPCASTLKLKGKKTTTTQA